MSTRRLKSVITGLLLVSFFVVGISNAATGGYDPGGAQFNDIVVEANAAWNDDVVTRTVTRIEAVEAIETAAVSVTSENNTATVLAFVADANVDAVQGSVVDFTNQRVETDAATAITNVEAVTQSAQGVHNVDDNIVSDTWNTTVAATVDENAVTQSASGALSTVTIVDSNASNTDVALSYAVATVSATTVVLFC